MFFIRSAFSRAGWISLSILTGFALFACMHPITPIPSETSPIYTKSTENQNKKVLFNHSAQHNDIRFVHLSDHEISRSSISGIIQDRTGFLWFGTPEGLKRYDGINFTSFQHEPDDPTSLSNNIIRTMFVDQAGTLWIGTNQGLNRFEDHTGQFSRITRESSPSGQLSGDEIKAISEGGHGVLWIGTDGGLDKFDLANGSINPVASHLLDTRQVTAILQDQYDILWIGTDDGLLMYDLVRETITNLRSSFRDTHSLSGNFIISLYEDHQGELWIGTTNGLSKYNRDEENFTQYKNNPRDEFSLSGNSVSVIFQDKSGVLWIGTENDGLNRLDRDTGKFIHYQNNPSNSNSLSSNAVLSVFEDREGVLWVGTIGAGINKASLRRGTFVNYRNVPDDPNSVSDNFVRAIYEDRNEILWIGTPAGLDRYDRETGQFHHFEHNRNDPFSLSDDFITAIYEDHNGVLWIGTLHGGLNRFDPNSETFYHYFHDPRDPLSLNNDTVRVIREDSSGTLWVGTNEGLNQYNWENDFFTSYQYFKYFQGSTVRTIHEDNSGRLWIGTDIGLFAFDPEVPTPTHYFYAPDDPASLSGDFVLSIHEDREGNLWVGTFQTGLNKFDPETKTFTHYRKSDGLPNDVIYAILEDNLGFLWLSTSNGLSRFDPTEEIFRNFDISDGLQSDEFNDGAYHQNQNGEIYFGGVDGITVFHPENVQENNFIPPVVLTALTQGGENVESDQAVEHIQSVTLTWPGDFFEFEFASLSFEMPNENQYAYMLEGFDDDWNWITNKHFGRYTNLPGGTYTLRVIASNNDGVWNREGDVVEITIVPPFWETWWFIGGVFLFVIGGVIISYRLRVRSVEKRSRQLEELVKEREAELAQRITESAIAAERNRLARDLHDAVTQTLFSASLIAEVLPKIWQQNQVEGRHRLGELRELTRGALAEMRALLLELRPASLAEAELGDLLQQLGESITGRARVPVTVRIEGVCEITPRVKIALYRIAQEALNNVAKHAGSCQTEINLDCRPGEIELSIRDNGSGFDLRNIPPESLGISIMRERADGIGAELDISSNVGVGTTIMVRLKSKLVPGENSNLPR